MGMFDSVIAKCPMCDGDVEFQTKAGDCSLRTYTSNEVPLKLAAAIQGDISSCDSCGAIWRIEADVLPPPITIKMRLE